MRFCHVTTFYPPYNFGGDGILVQQICEGLARRGHEVDVVHCVDAYHLKGGPATQTVADPPNIRRHALRSGLGLLSPLITQQTGRPGLKYDKLEQILSQRYDVVHFHNISLVGGPGVLRMSRAPVTLYTAHDHWLVCPAHVLWKYRNRPCDRPQCFSCSIRSGIPPQLWRYSTLLERCLEYVDALLVPSRFTADKLREAGISRPIELLNSFSRLVPGDGSAEPGFRSGKPLFVYAGRLESSKGLEHLLETFSLRPGYDLCIAGEGSLAAGLKARYADDAHIRFLGTLAPSHLAALFREADAVVSPTWGPEAFPLVNIEAMACGTPVIGRRSGGSVEAIERTGGGLSYNEPHELLPLLDRIANNPDLRSDLAAKAIAGFGDYYSEARWMEHYLTVIERINGLKSGCDQNRSCT
jgi:glycosyltransferase involved in cell wall biosynthesis